MRFRTVAGAAVAASCASVLLLPAQAQAAGSLHIHKIYYNSPGSDRGSNSSLNAEYVQIRNGRSVDVSLKGWTIKDSAGHTYTFGKYTLRSGNTVTIKTGEGDNTGKVKYWGQGWYVWNNDSDKATLRRGSGTVMDTCSYDNDDVAYRMC